MKRNITFIRDIPMYTLVEFSFVKACFINFILPILFLMIVFSCWLHLCKHIYILLIKLPIYPRFCYTFYWHTINFCQGPFIASVLIFYQRLKLYTKKWCDNALARIGHMPVIAFFKQMLFITVRSFRECLKPSWKRGRGMKNWEQSLPRQSSKTNK